MRTLSSLSLFIVTVTLLAACKEGTYDPYGDAANGGSSGGGGASSSAEEGGQGNSGGASASTENANPPFSTEGCTVTPVNPKATEQAKKLLCYLYSINGNSVLSGQQETSWNWGTPTPSVDVEWIKAQTGKYPAVLGGDYLYPGDQGQNAPGTTDRAKAWWAAGGIPMIRYHMGAPPLDDTYDNSKSSVADLDNVVTSGTKENESFNAKLNYAAYELKVLQTAGVAVLWAPLHEVQANGWFWWSKGTGEQFVAIWKYIYNYLTKTKGLNNLVWLLPFSGDPSADYYPGKEYVDIAGPDTYNMTSQPFANLYNATQSVVGTTTPIPLHETGKVPNPADMFPSAAPWVLFNIWSSFENDATKNSVAEIKATYSSRYTITRDEVPGLK